MKTDLSLLRSPSILLKSDGWAGRGIGFLLGGLCVLGQAPLHFWPLSLIGLAFLFLRLEKTSSSIAPRRAGFHSAFWFALGYFGVGVFWVGEAFIARGAAFIPVMPPMILGLAAILALFWAFAGLLFAGSRLKPIWSQIVFVTIFTLSEIARGYLFSGFPWNLTGYIFPAGGAFSQGAAFWTIYGQSCFVFAGAALLATLFTNETARRKWIAGGVLFLSLGGLYGFGTMRLSNATVIPQDNILLRIVSIPFDQADKFNPDKSINIVSEFLRESLKDEETETMLSTPLREVTHIIWPEGAVSGLAMENEPLLLTMSQELSRRLGGDNLPVWLLNSLRHESRFDPNSSQIIDDYYNSSVAITFDSAGTPNIAAFNDKARLVPFGEFIPFGKWMESKNVPVISTNLLSISAAKSKRLTQFPGLPLGSPQICYEIIFPGFTPHPKTGNKAEFILNQSNDAWFGKSWGPAQHANIARYRAIEEGLPVIRAASNGVSGVFDPYGRIFAKTNIETPSHIDTKLPKPLKKIKKTNQIIALLFLINLFLSLVCIKLGRGLNNRAIN
ncbi:apolipoprotein N-acyltransferase [Litorimonas taeanensis]|uniref:Apolipoprotein N-acyltransferase n=1 Tax=Litorimonas taeanensis TaxID=568099 RepID=A0A420WET9_9PROT|nr:apolipoprotein N-acyltransferase [Litorimonas taeanensis]RKQ69495.1 apolipoprotein N-acyltransferase [Litorimonas taeanensis]